MIALKSPSLSCLSASLGLATILCYGCAADGVRQQAAYDRKIQHTEQLLIAAGEADSLAAAAMLSVGPTFDPAQRLTLSAKRAWPEGSPTYVDAISARRVAHYRIDADGKISLRRFLFSGFAAKRRQLM